MLISATIEVNFGLKVANTQVFQTRFWISYIFATT